jgi:3,4-dihydroxy-2-butanone 4-phosphate synthase
MPLSASPVEGALKDLRQGKMVVLVDDDEGHLRQSTLWLRMAGVSSVWR